MGLTENGYETPTLEEVVNDIRVRQRTVFPELNLDPATPDGQLNHLLAEAIHMAYEVGAGIYNGMDPRAASGIMLDRICAISGIVRQEATRSIVYLLFTGTPGAVIPAGTQVGDTHIPSRTFITQRQGSIGADGTVQIEARAEVEGPMTIPAGTVINLLNPLPGVDAVTNPSDGISGRDRETDEELRIRREMSLSLPGSATVNAMLSRIGQVEGVEDVRVYENPENTDSPEGIPPHSVYCVVEGGGDGEIANAIMETKTVGAGLHGSETVTWYDDQGFGHLVRFDRPTPVEITIYVEVTTALYGPDIEERVRTAIMEYVTAVRNGSAECLSGNLGIGDPVLAATFYGALAGEQDFNPVVIEVESPTVTRGSVVTLSISEVAAFDASRIIVSEHGAP